MKKNKSMKKRAVSGRKLVIMLLSAALMFNMFLLAGRIVSNNSEYAYNLSDMYSSLQSGDYADIKQMVEHNEAKGLTEKAGTQDFNTFVKYYESKELYEAFTQNGDFEKAEEQRVIMQAALDALPLDILNKIS